MDPNNLRQFVILSYTGLSEGLLLALIALGLVLIYKATDVINFAHGEFMLLGGYVAYELLAVHGLPLAVGLVIAALILVAVGVLVERLILRPLIGEPVISVIMVTIGLANVIDAIVGIIWGAQPRALPQIFPHIFEGDSYRLIIEGARRPALLPYDRVYTMIVVVALVLLFALFFRRSKEGIAMRAAADDQQAAMSMGISIKRVFALTWSIAALTAGIAGLMVANLTEVSGNISGVGLRAFPVIILGGLDSLPGAVIGGLIIGLLEQYASGYIDPSLKAVVPYVVLILILMVRPYGLFGRKVIERV